MRKALALIVVMAGCGPGIPNPNPTPTPQPTAKPIGFNCLEQPELRGMVSVANAIAGRYIVVLKNKTPTNIQPLMSIEGVTNTRQTREGYAAQLSLLALSKILADPNVLYVQEDGVKSVSPMPASSAASWGLDRVDQRDLPMDGAYNPDNDGAGINIAVVDTGITDLPDFHDGNVSRLQLPCFSAHGGCQDGHGHGTHVAGTAAGNVYGIAKKAKLWVSRVLDSNGSGADSDVIRGIEWVTGKKRELGGSWVINMSLGGGDSPALNRATCEAIAAGVVVVAAAGNEAHNADTSSPARVQQAITIGASDRADKQATFSNFGVLLDLYAPGVEITSDQPGGGTATWNGTSMATPHVAGAVALYLQRHPAATPQEVSDGLAAASTTGHMGDISGGSPNRLLYVRDVP